MNGKENAMFTFSDFHRAFSGTPTGLTLVVAATAGVLFYLMVTKAVDAAARREHRANVPMSDSTFQESPYTGRHRNHHAHN